jgi:hypothetical protein
MEGAMWPASAQIWSRSIYPSQGFVNVYVSETSLLVCVCRDACKRGNRRTSFIVSLEFAEPSNFSTTGQERLPEDDLSKHPTAVATTRLILRAWDGESKRFHLIHH